jgi:Carbohydrate binding domain
MAKIFCFYSLWLCSIGHLIAQNTNIAFTNPSFEDTPRASASPMGWYSYTPGSTPDILPGAWEIDFKAQDGATCVGLVTRENGTSEDISQTLSTTLGKGHCYSFTLYLAHAASYVGYNKPTRLRIWGGAVKGQKTQLLCASPLIDHSDWRQYEFQFEPTSDIKHLTFEVYFAPGAMFFYKGNIIIDNVSEIEDCDRA